MANRPVIGPLIRDVYHDYRRLLKEQLDTHAITLTQWGILRHLLGQDGITQKILSEHVGVHPSPTVEAIRKLEERQFIRRLPDPTDGRAMRVFLTKQGRNIMDALLEITVEVNQIACEALSDDELCQLEALLTKIHGTSRPPEGQI